MADSIYNELFKVPSEKFQKHLESDVNERILFSGKFGKGKTTFLQYFFDDRKKSEGDQEYFTIHISPVNYAVATNEDIFKLIKFDIILEFLRKGIEFEESDFGFMDTLPLFIRKHPEKIIGKLLSFIPVVGKELDEVFEKGKKLYEEIREHNLKTNDKGEANLLEKYIETIEATEGSIYENDFITKIIEKAIAKQERENKKTVLIIDDLDRLDPEHIFRILNVFAAQFNNYKGGEKLNKFNLSKIIVVCDLDNIRNIYKNRYGADVDFIGYVDKFYSSEPFFFNNYNELREVTSLILAKIQGETQSGIKSFDNYINDSINNKRCTIGIIDIIANILFFDFISLRALLNYSKGKVFNLSERIKIAENQFDNYDFPLMIEAQIINSLLGGFDNAIHVFGKLENISSTMSHYKYHYNMILYFMTYPDGGYNYNKTEAVSADFDKMHFNFNVSGREIENLKVFRTSIYADFQPNHSDYFRALKLLFTRLYQNGIIE